MKKIEATIRAEKIKAVLRALEVIGCKDRLVRDSCTQGKHLCLELVAGDSEVDQIIGVILATARTGEIGDGKICVSPLDAVIRIRNGERGVPGNSGC